MHVECEEFISDCNNILEKTIYLFVIQQKPIGTVQKLSYP